MTTDGITPLARIIIRSAGSDITCDAAGPIDGLFRGQITYWEAGEVRIEGLVTTEFIFRTVEEAQQAMADVVNEIRRMEGE